MLNIYQSSTWRHLLAGANVRWQSCLRSRERFLSVSIIHVVHPRTLLPWPVHELHREEGPTQGPTPPIC